MVTTISKPYAVVSEEWADICDKFREAQSVLYSTQNPMLKQFPSDEQWTAYLSAQEQYETARKEMEDYRRTVLVSN